MKYLIITQDPTTGERSGFYTNWYYFNNNYNMIVIDRMQHLITFDGETWQDIEDDHL
jgi:S-formylglutathione hydrolase FrmB